MDIEKEPSTKANGRAAAPATKTSLAEALRDNEKSILAEWIEEQLRRLGQKITAAELRTQCEEFLRHFTVAVQGDANNIHATSWKMVREFLASVSRSRGVQGFTPSETATFVFSMKKPIFAAIRSSFSAEEAVEVLWTATLLLDALGLYTTEIYQKTREEVIARQQQDLLELSTPVVKLWDGILALPMIGTLDSSRTQVVMETLLQKIVETNSELAIIDITGVPTVDTLVAQHLIKTVTAARLMGAECLISGVRPQIAATIVHLGVDLGNITTKATLADAFSLALTKLNRKGGRESALRALARGQAAREAKA